MVDSYNEIFDVCIIGGGINGAGIARDSAGQGLKTILFEAQDFASATSSASSKLVHGGLRYLENYEFSLVRKSLVERKKLLKIAPHIIWPLDFILPHEPHLRPRWLLRLGLYVYDILGLGTGFKRSRIFQITAPLKPHLKHGFVYTDCWVDDARLVLLNIIDAAEKGAVVCRDTRVTSVEEDDDDLYTVTTHDRYTGEVNAIRARTVVNAAGPWAEHFLDDKNLRLVKGSHIVVPRLFDHNKAYILQNKDGRIVFAIPYESDYTLVGTTDVNYSGDPRFVTIDQDEKRYLITLINSYFEKQITEADIVKTFSGVRPLIDDGKDNASRVTRDYSFDEDDGYLHILGGKLTTYRVLAEEAMTYICDELDVKQKRWTDKKPLPGGDINDRTAFIERMLNSYESYPPFIVERLAGLYGSRIHMILNDDKGREIAPGILNYELDYLIEHEYARTADDVLWRRTKMGYHLMPQGIEAVEKYMQKKTGFQDSETA